MGKNDRSTLCTYGRIWSFYLGFWVIYVQHIHRIHFSGKHSFPLTNAFSVTPGLTTRHLKLTLPLAIYLNINILFLPHEVSNSKKSCFEQGGYMPKAVSFFCAIEFKCNAKRPTVIIYFLTSLLMCKHCEKKIKTPKIPLEIIDDGIRYYLVWINVNRIWISWRYISTSWAFLEHWNVYHSPLIKFSSPHKEIVWDIISRENPLVSKRKNDMKKNWQLLLA
jgi:hypothetical protein